MESDSPPEFFRASGAASGLLWSVAALLTTASAVTLGIALTLPTVFFHALNGPEEIYSIYGGVQSLWKDGNRTSATIVFVFSIVFPAGKLLFLAWLCLRRRVARGSSAVLRVLVMIGKWSLVDVFIIALFVGSFLPSMLARSSSRPGIHLFAVAILLSMFAARLVALLVGVRESRRAPRQGVGFRWRGVLSLASLVLLALALREFYYLIKPPRSFPGAFLIKGNSIGLLPTIKLLWSEGEARMALYLGAFILSAPIARGVLGMWLACVRRSAVRAWADRLAEWAMLDVFVLALALVYDKLSELTDTSLQAGFWYLVAAAGIAELDAWLIRWDRRQGMPTPGGSSS